MAQLTDIAQEQIEKSNEFIKEVFDECIPTYPSKERLNGWSKFLWSFIHIPYFPAFHRPGWLLRYMLGPYNKQYFERMQADVAAGLTVGLVLIPQGLSYGALANLPPVVGLYSSIMPSAAYIFFGSSMQLAVGPVAIVSLLMGQLITQYNIDYVNNPQLAIDCAAQASFCVGIILTVMGILNLGSLINFMAYPVMSGFTTAAACLIGLSQLKDAVGFMNTKPAVPQAGQAGYEYNYLVMQWFAQNWNGVFTTTTAPKPNAVGLSYRNHFAAEICFGLYVPLLIFSILKSNIKATPERKNLIWYKIFVLFCALLPLFAIIIGAHVAWSIVTEGNQNDFYATNLKVVGSVPSGLNIIKIPTFHYPFGQFFIDVIPMTLISFMESYSVSRRIAAKRNELHILNASQEMWANGAANLLGSISTSYPVSGSFSRSSLNYTAGANTPLAKTTTLIVILLALGTLSQSFYWIPRAALSAVVFVAIFNLIAVGEFWDAWKHSKKDFLTMIVTFTLVFVYGTSVGLAVGLGFSLIVYLGDIVMNRQYDPTLESFSATNDGITVVKLNSDLNFLTYTRIKDFITTLTIREPPVPDANTSRADYIFHTVTTAMDTMLVPKSKSCMYCKNALPLAIVIDMEFTRVVDITGLQALAEMLSEARDKGVKGVIINVDKTLVSQFIKYGIKNDSSTPIVNLDRYLCLSTLDVMDASPTGSCEDDNNNGGSSSDFSRSMKNESKLFESYDESDLEMAEFGISSSVNKNLN